MIPKGPAILPPSAGVTCVRVSCQPAPEGRGWCSQASLWSRRVERPDMYRQTDGSGAPSVTSVLDDAIVGDNILDWVTPWSWERGRLDV
jgi:hypothetical protein